MIRGDGLTAGDDNTKYYCGKNIYDSYKCDENKKCEFDDDCPVGEYCFDVKDGNIDKIFPLIDKNFKKYDETFLKKINLKYVVLCENLSVAGIGAAGVPNYLMKTLMMKIKKKKLLKICLLVLN